MPFTPQAPREATKTRPTDRPAGRSVVAVIKLVVGVLVALLGLALTGGGLWLAMNVGPNGSATFTGTPNAAGTVVLTPEVLNRLDADVTVTAEPGAGGAIWMGVSSPSDASDILAVGPVQRVDAVDQQAWRLLFSASGEGDPHALAVADIWRTTEAGDGPVSITLTQESAPESLVIAADTGTVESVTLTVERKEWFVQALVGVLVGLALMLGGWLLFRSARRPTQEPAVADGPTPASTDSPTAGSVEAQGGEASDGEALDGEAPDVEAHDEGATR